VAVFFADHTRDRSEAEISVWLMELGCADALFVQRVPQTLKLLLVPDREMNVAWVVVGRATVLIGVFDSRMCSLNSLLREWEIAARDRVQVVLGKVLGLHDGLTSS
jgi:hypothetical protein